VEHYGLKRKKLSNGEYEKVTILHSWNAPHRFSNYMLFKVQRHSDHHENSSKPYQTLLSLDESPQLPHGYFIMTVMVFFPSTFQRIMNPLFNEKEGNQNVEDLERKQNEAISETRKFVVKVTVWSTILCLLSLILIK
jgi:alkane 1-monooxygenase